VSALVWKPQRSYLDFFYHDNREIFRKSTVFREDIEYFVPYGGRGSGKTYSFLDAVIVEATLRPIRVLCAREYQISIKESIKAELEAAIDHRGLGKFFSILRDEIRCITNGSLFMFKGIKNNIRNLKSICDVDILLCEESDAITKNSWDKLLPSIRPRKPFGKRGLTPINIIIFNPDDELDDTYQRFIINTPPMCVTKLINWRDNVHFPEHLNRQRLHSLKTRPLKDHEHDWEGKPKASGEDVIIDRDWIRAARFASSNPDFVHLGEKVVSYDPSGQGRDYNAEMFADGNIIKSVDEWLKSLDLRVATYRAFDSAIDNKVKRFVFDVCGGLGDGVSVFVNDRKEEVELETKKKLKIDIFPFDAGAPVVNPDKKIPEVGKTWKELYSNAKAQAQAITAQKLYNTYRFIVLGERDIDPAEMQSIDIEDDALFNKLVVELSTPIWVKSKTNSKKKVESKSDMMKRTGLPSGNIADTLHMINAPQKKHNRFNG